MKIALIAGIMVLSASVVSCAQKELDDLSKAQQCLDQVPASNPATATNCLQYTNNYSSQRANVLKCSIYLTSGGITTPRMAGAYTASQDPSVPAANKQAMYISYLALVSPDAAGGYTLAQTANPYCLASGDTGLIFVSDMAVIGSLTNTLVPGGIDFTASPASISSAVQTALGTCQTTPASCDPNVLAPAAASAAATYCATTNANPTVCNDVNQSVNSWGSSNATMTQGLMCLLAGKTFTPPATCT